MYGFLLLVLFPIIHVYLDKKRTKSTTQNVNNWKCKRIVQLSKLIHILPIFQLTHVTVFDIKLYKAPQGNNKMQSL